MRSRLVSLDLGNGFSKYCAGAGVEGFYPSVYALEEPGISFEGLTQVDDFVIEYQGIRYALGWSAHRLGNITIRNLDRSRVEGQEYRVLFAAALAQTCNKSQTISPVLSLPVSWYDKREKVRKNLTGLWEVKYKDRPLQIVVDGVRLIPEGFGALCSLALDRSGGVRSGELLDQRVGIVDIGTKTTDLILFDSLTYVPVKTRGYEVGLEMVYNIMDRQADQALGMSYNYEQLDDILHGHRLYSGPHDVTDQADEWKHSALAQVAASVSNQINTLWSSGNDAQRLLITGGGAAHIYPYLLRQFDHCELVPNGPMANVYGGYSYGLMRRNYEPA